jgi:multicomponent Na+:H+ antiporter subunit B
LFEDKFKPFLFVYCALLAFILIYASGDLPEFGSPKFNHYYLQNSKNDTGIISVVASILASYRGFDTMLETLVILSAGMGVLLISGEEKFIEKAQDKLTAVMIRIMLPIILLFALYIQFHGEISPGGGFQAGCIIATIFITYALGFGDNILLKTISNFNLKIITIIGISLYILVGMIGLLGGQDFLNYNVFFGQTIGVMLVELGVGITVSSTMLLIYLRVSSNASN